MTGQPHPRRRRRQRRRAGRHPGPRRSAPRRICVLRNLGKRLSAHKIRAGFNGSRKALWMDADIDPHRGARSQLGKRSGQPATSQGRGRDPTGELPSSSRAASSWVSTPARSSRASSSPWSSNAAPCSKNAPSRRTAPSCSSRASWPLCVAGLHDPLSRRGELDSGAHFRLQSHVRDREAGWPARQRLAVRGPEA
jgi:hypothetical protein